jgi:hypothetical protein
MKKNLPKPRFRFFTRKKLFACLLLLSIGTAASAQTSSIDQISNVKVTYDAVPNGVGDTSVRVRCLITLSDSTPIKKLHVKVGTTPGGGNIANHVINYKGTPLSSVLQSSSTAVIQKVNKSAHVLVGTMHYQDLYYEIKAERTDGSLTPVHTITEIH